MGPTAGTRKARGCGAPPVGKRGSPKRQKVSKTEEKSDEEKSDEEKSDDEVRESSIVGCSLVLLGGGEVEIYWDGGTKLLGSFKMEDMIAAGGYGMGGLMWC
jgi:hypothetical protein